MTTRIPVVENILSANDRMAERNRLLLDQAGVYSINIMASPGAGKTTNGSVVRLSINGRWYRGFVKRVWGAWDPSVNHLVIVEDDPRTQHAFSTYTDDDYHAVSGLPSGSTLHYLLFASRNGGYVDDAAMLRIMESYLTALPTPWLGVSPTAGSIPAGGFGGGARPIRRLLDRRRRFRHRPRRVERRSGRAGGGGSGHAARDRGSGPRDHR